MKETMIVDTLQKFTVDNAPVRGELIELSTTWQQVLSRHNYPSAVRTLLGEMLAASALLTANLKFNGALIMQIYGDGPVKLLVVECDADLRMRATAKLTENAVIDDAATLTQMVNANGQGRFAITLDPKDKLPGQQAYQGIVPLDGDNTATVIENYMLRSEQLDTRLWLAANDNVSRGLLLQKLPVEGGSQPHDDQLEAWNRLVFLASTLHTPELLETNIKSLMHKLFWEETLRVFDPVHPQFHCSCSREKVGNMLRMLGKEEIDDALSTLKTLNIDCDFCGLHYEFDAIDCAHLFADTLPVKSQPNSNIKH